MAQETLMQTQRGWPRRSRHWRRSGQRLHAADATFLDVGTGTGWLAIATARAYPTVHVVGIDIHEPALDLARRNVADEQLDRAGRRATPRCRHRRRSGAVRRDLASPSVPSRRHRLAGAGRLHRTLRPGGWLLAGTLGGTGDRLSELLVDLRTVRSGGHPWRADEVVELLAQHGLTDTREVPRTWPSPIHLYAGRRP